jgi:hypothetical protein
MKEAELVSEALLFEKSGIMDRAEDVSQRDYK